MEGCYWAPDSPDSYRDRVPITIGKDHALLEPRRTTVFKNCPHKKQDLYYVFNSIVKVFLYQKCWFYFAIFWRFKVTNYKKVGLVPNHAFLLWEKVGLLFKPIIPLLEKLGLVSKHAFFQPTIDVCVKNQRTCLYLSFVLAEVVALVFLKDSLLPSLGINVLSFLINCRSVSSFTSSSSSL